MLLCVFALKMGRVDRRFFLTEHSLSYTILSYKNSGRERQAKRCARRTTGSDGTLVA
jgi:hypothetical protein